MARHGCRAQSRLVVDDGIRAGVSSRGTTPRSRGLRLGQLGPLLLLVVVTSAVYANSLHNNFLFDDLETIVEAQGRGGPGQLTPLFSLLQGKPAYRPIRSASYAFDYALSGLDPWGYHLTNIAYHTLSAIVVFLIAQSVFNRLIPALFTAILFAVHPIQTEAVTYLSGRRDVLSGLFVLTGFYMFLRYRQTGRGGYLATVLLLYLLAFFSKESGIILPLLCFSYDVISRIRVKEPGIGLPPVREIWVGVRSAVREGRLFYIPLMVLAGGLALYVLFLVRGTWVRTYYGGSLPFTGFTMSRVFLHYIALLLFPLTLNADYSYNAFPVTTSWADPNAWVAVLILGMLGYGLLVCLKSRPLVAFGGAWFFLALLPVSQIVPHHEMMAEHFLYVPSVGFCLVVAALADSLLDSPRRVPAIYSAALAALLLLSFRTVWRNTDWRDELTLWSKTVQVAPQSARARNNLGSAYLRRGQLTRAEQELETAVQIKPDFAVAHGNLGKIALDRDDLERAERELQTAIGLKANEVIPRLWLGAVYMRRGRVA
ncbi:tetratricopeptide repeat protein, partial [Candidatus Methylomirabilis sp.]|uniref:tetratricopeptide repeat protein n=1 Tax=Candidatus Methylomirabilis sp. TaxID=2032687 RepID=UPI003C71D198